MEEKTCKTCTHYKQSTYKILGECCAPVPEWVEWLDADNRVSPEDGVGCDVWIEIIKQ